METVNEIFSQQHPLLPGLILAIILGLALLFSLSPWRQLISHWRLNHLVNKLGIESLKNVYIPDGIGGVIYAERLFLQNDRLLLVTIKPFRGNIFAAEQIDQWTQVIGHRSYKFPNPIHQQEADLQALRAIVNKQKVTGLIVFAKGSQFPKGKPDAVFDYEQLKKMGRAKSDKAINDELKDVWHELVSKAESAANMKQKILFRREDRRGLIIGLVLFLFGTAFVVWYLSVYFSII